MKIRCECGYEWNYKGNLRFATCPNCRKKIGTGIVNQIKREMEGKDEKQLNNQ